MFQYVQFFRLFQHRHSRFACPKAVHRKNHGRRSKIQSFFQLSTSKGLLLSMLMVLVHGPKLRRFWKFLVFKWIISIKNMRPQFVRCPKDCRTSVEHRPLIQIGNHWSVGFPRELLKKKALVTWWPTLQNWSKGSGNGCGTEQSCAAIIQRNLQPWANCSMVEVVLGRQKTGVQGCLRNSNGKFTLTPLKPPGTYQRRSQLARQVYKQLNTQSHSITMKYSTSISVIKLYRIKIPWNPIKIS